MNVRLRITALGANGAGVTGELKLPATAAGIFPLTPETARQLAHHLNRLADLCEDVAAAGDEADG